MKYASRYLYNVYLLTLTYSFFIITSAIHNDLRKPKFESVVTELSMLFEDIELTLENLDKWIKPRKVAKPNLLWALDTVQMTPEPYGVMLIIVPWNYPIQLSLVPLVGAIAAGNCVIIKVSMIYLINLLL